MAKLGNLQRWSLRHLASQPQRSPPQANHKARLTRRTWSSQNGFQRGKSCHEGPILSPFNYIPETPSLLLKLIRLQTKQECSSITIRYLKNCPVISRRLYQFTQRCFLNPGFYYLHFITQFKKHRIVRERNWSFIACPNKTNFAYQVLIDLTNITNDGYVL